MGILAKIGTGFFTLFLYAVIALPVGFGFVGVWKSDYVQKIINPKSYKEKTIMKIEAEITSLREGIKLSRDQKKECVLKLAAAQASRQYDINLIRVAKIDEYGEKLALEAAEIDVEKKILALREDLVDTDLSIEEYEFDLAKKNAELVNFKKSP